MTAILKKELSAYKNSFFVYLYYAIFFLFTGLLLANNIFKNYSTQYGLWVLAQSYVITAVFIPICTMRLLAQERKLKTDQLLFTSPVSVMSVLMGKYFATLIVLFLPYLITAVYPVIIAFHGDMNVKYLMASYIAVCLVILVMLSIGMFVSSIVSNSILAAVITYAAFGIIMFGRLIEAIFVDGVIFDFAHKTSIYNMFVDMTSGIVRVGDMAFCILLAVLFMFLTWNVLEGRRSGVKKSVIKSIAETALVIVISAVLILNPIVLDFTPERLLTLSDKSYEVVSGISKDTTIYYIGKEMNANATYKELLTRYEKMSKKLNVEYIDPDISSDFVTKYFYEIDQIKEGSMLVVCGERCVYLDVDDYMHKEQISSVSAKTVLNIENQLTGAIAYTNSEDSHRIAVATGNSEAKIDSLFYNSILLNNINITSTDMLDEAATVEDFFYNNELVIINAPADDIANEEKTLLEDYVKQGGRVLVTIDPIGEDKENLYGFLSDFGLDMEQGVVCEGRADKIYDNTLYYLLPNIEDTPFTKGIIESGKKVFSGTTKGIITNDKAEKRMDILTTSTKAYSKLSGYDRLDYKTDEDVMGPFAVASYVEHESGGGIMLVSTDLLFNNDANSVSAGGNLEFVVDSVNTLIGNEYKMNIPGKEVMNELGLYSRAFMKGMKIVTIGVIPALILILGILNILFRNGILKMPKKIKKDSAEKAKKSTKKDEKSSEKDENSAEKGEE